MVISSSAHRFGAENGDGLMDDGVNVASAVRLRFRAAQGYSYSAGPIGGNVEMPPPLTAPPGGAQRLN